jgi:hypothetical protein
MADDVVRELREFITFIEPDLPLRGVLVNDLGGYEIWLPYSVESIKLLERNKLIGVKNIASIRLNTLGIEPDEFHLSLLRIVDVTARHFQVDAIRESRAHAPTSVEKFIDETLKGWQRRAADAEEINLRIVLRAEPTNFEWYLPLGAELIKSNYVGVRQECGRPILGEVCYLMNESVVERVVNRGFPDPVSESAEMKSAQIIEMGTHALYPSKHIGVMLDTKALIKRHFGLFGFTGSGKSNLLSTLLSSTMETDTPTNLIVMDANNEYFGLLLDVLVKHDAHVLFVGDESIEASMQEFLRGRVDFIDEAAEEFITTTIWSNETERFWKQSPEARGSLLEIVKILLMCGTFKVFIPSTNERSFDHLKAEIIEWLDTNKFSGSGSRDRNAFLKKKVPVWLELLVEDATAAISIPMIESIQKDLAAALKSTDSAPEVLASSSVLGRLLSASFEDPVTIQAVGSKLSELNAKLAEIAETITPPESGFRHTMGLTGLTRALHDRKKSTIIVLGDETSLRDFAHSVGMALYRLRKRTKFEKIPTAFIFDEADLFVPQRAPNEDEKDSVERSKEVATMLARRGRKYNLGLGISTQRVVYLDTSIMGQIGTYFVGRLPRASDRQRIVEGFGVEEAMITEGVRGIGNWTVLSHSAVGDKGAPIPVHFTNADRRIIEFIRSFDLSAYSSLAESLRRADYYAAMERERNKVVRDVSHTDYLPNY